MGPGQGEPVTELPPGFTISESINGVVSLVKDHPSLIQPEEVAAIEEAVKQHPDASQYRTAVKHNLIEIYEQVSPDYETLCSHLQATGLFPPGLAGQAQPKEEYHPHYAPVLLFL